MTDNDHNAFLSMHESLDCENPFDECMQWDWDEWEDWEDEQNPRHWWV
jgi:hypothetical protein